MTLIHSSLFKKTQLWQDILVQKQKLLENLASPFSEKTNPSKKEIILQDSMEMRDEEVKKSEYAVQLMEKQKAKFTYGILERQFRNLFEKASRSKGVTGEVLLQLCESRLDNVVYRFGLSPSRSGARQLVSHRHITVNGSIVNIPSYQVKVGDVVGVREKSKSLNIIVEAKGKDSSVYEWLSWNSDQLQGTFVNVPERLQIPENIKEQLIVELYSK
jgi:small subunit ribosomal protein S4